MNSTRSPLFIPTVAPSSTLHGWHCEGTSRFGPARTRQQQQQRQRWRRPKSARISIPTAIRCSIATSVTNNDDGNGDVDSQRHGGGGSGMAGSDQTHEACGGGAADVRSPRVSIEYCTGCRWGLRAAWMAQELLVTFEHELGEVALCPSAVPGTFDVHVGAACVWSRARDGGFPELKVLKRLVRDVVSPQQHLGHSDARQE